MATRPLLSIRSLMLTRIWKYRKRETNYAQSFFQLWVWDELDNTLNNADDPKAVGEKFKNFLKQAHHTGVGLDCVAVNR
jgi:hypothetical protein